MNKKKKLYVNNFKIEGQILRMDKMNVNYKSLTNGEKCIICGINP